MTEPAERNPASDSVALEPAPRLESLVVLATVHAGAALAALIAAFLAGYPLFVKLAPATVPHLAVQGSAVGLKVQLVLYAFSFGILLPCGLFTASRHVRALERRQLDSTLVAIVNLAGLAVVLAAVRVALAGAPGPGDPDREQWVRLASLGSLVALAALVLANLVVTSRLRAPAARQAPARRDVLLVAVGVAASLVFIPSSAFAPGRGLLAAAIAIAAFAAWRYVRRAVLTRGMGLAADALLLALTVLLVWDVRWPTGVWMERMAKYQGVYVGPANMVLNGGTMFVDTFTQYGAGLTYFFAGLFTLIPIDYGSFALAITVLDVILYLVTYAVLRLAGASRVVTAAAVAVSAFTGVLTHPPAAGGYTMVPNRPLRLLLPLLVVLVIQLAARHPARRVAASWTVAALVGFSSFWATEVFVYAAAAALAMVAAQGRLDAPVGRALALDRRELWRIAGVTVVVQVTFNLGTRLAAGSWPDWLQYVEYQGLYAGGQRSQMLAPFGPGLLLGAVYFASASACVAILMRNRSYAREHRNAIVSICGVAAVAVAYYSYYVGQAAVFNVHKMAPILVLLTALWLSLLDEGGPSRMTAVRVGIGVFAVWCASAALIGKQSLFLSRFGQTALGAGPAATIHDIRFAASSPAALPQTPQAVDFLRRALGDVRRPLVLLPDVLTTEVLLHARTIGPLPIGDPYQDSLLPSRVVYLQGLARSLPVGTRFLSRVDYWRKSETLSSSETNHRLLYTLRQTFVIRPVAAGPGGLRVYRIEARR